MTRALNVVLSIAIVMGAAACGGGSSETADVPPPAAPAAPAASAAPSAGGHAHTAPNGGTLTELGDHFAFLELVVEPGTGRVTLYVLDGEAERAVRVSHPTLTLVVAEPAAVTLSLAAVANTLTGETVGDSSQFAATSDALKGATSLKGRLSGITIKGQALSDIDVTWSTSKVE